MDDPPPANESPKREGTRDWFGVLVSLAALATSITSITLSIQNSGEMDRLVQANSWPYLALETGNVTENGAAEIYVQLKNAGIGPLRIASFVVTYERAEVPNFGPLIRACCLAEDVEINSEANFNARVGGVVTSRPTGAVLRPGDRVTVYTFASASANPAVWAALDKARFESRYRACYCSVFDECWTTDFADKHQEPIETCPAEQNSWQG